MKKTILVLWLIGSTFFSFAQKDTPVEPVAVPIDTITNLITYSEVVVVKDISAEELYIRIQNWFNTYYKNPTEVIRENNSEKMTIVGKPRFRISNLKENDAGKTDGGVVQYTITVSARQGRFKYELTSFNWKQASYYPCENWMNLNSASYAPIYNDYLQKLDEDALKTITSLKNAVMVEKPVKDNDSW